MTMHPYIKMPPRLALDVIKCERCVRKFWSWPFKVKCGGIIEFFTDRASACDRCGFTTLTVAPKKTSLIDTGVARRLAEVVPDPEPDFEGVSGVGPLATTRNSSAFKYVKNLLPDSCDWYDAIHATWHVYPTTRRREMRGVRPSLGSFTGQRRFAWEKAATLLGWEKTDAQNS